MKLFFNQNSITLTGSIIGGFAGFLYAFHKHFASPKFILGGDPAQSLILGAVFGGLLFNIFQIKRNKKKAR